jgi:hypothetical protein
MGNTIGKNDCVNIEGHEITKESYTVKRTSGEMELEWVMGAGCGSPEWITENAFKKEGEWRIFMNNGKDDINTVVQGWRRLSTICPTRLEGDQGGIDEWRKMVETLLDGLEEVREKANVEERKEAFNLVDEAKNE